MRAVFVPMNDCIRKYYHVLMCVVRPYGHCSSNQINFCTSSLVESAPIIIPLAKIQRQQFV